MIKLILISDTHRKKFPLPSGDILIHSGDFSGRGDFNETIEFLDWMKNIRHQYSHIVITPGNHDRWVESNIPLAKEMFKEHNIDLLIDEAVCLDGLNIYGTPWSPIFGNWSFMKSEKDLKKHFEAIPDGTNVLVTHCPPYGILDQLDENGSEPFKNVGSKSLQKELSRLDLDLHVFGHIHCQSGITKTDRTLFVNAASVNESYNLEQLYKIIYI